MRNIQKSMSVRASMRELGTVSTTKLDDNEQLELPRIGILLTALAVAFKDESQRTALLSQIPKSWNLVGDIKSFSGHVSHDLGVVYGQPFAIMGTLEHDQDNRFKRVPFVAFASPVSANMMTPRQKHGRDHHKHRHGQNQLSSRSSELASPLSSNSLGPFSPAGKAQGQNPSPGLPSSTPSPGPELASPAAPSGGGGGAAGSPSTETAVASPVSPTASTPRQIGRTKPHPVRSRGLQALMRARGHFHAETFMSTGEFEGKKHNIGQADKNTLILYDKLRQQGLVTEFVDTLHALQSEHDNIVAVNSSSSKRGFPAADVPPRPTALIVGHGIGAGLATLLIADLAVSNSTVFSYRKHLRERKQKKAEKAGAAQSDNNAGAGAGVVVDVGKAENSSKGDVSRPDSPATNGGGSSKSNKTGQSGSQRGLNDLQQPLPANHHLTMSERLRQVQKWFAGDKLQKENLNTLPQVRVFLYGSPRVLERDTARKLSLMAFHENVVRFICGGDIVPSLHYGSCLCSLGGT